MADIMLTQEMERYAVIVAICSKHTDMEILRFLVVARSFVHKVRKELEATGGETSPVAKCKKHKQCSDTTRTPQFMQQVQEMIDESPGTSMRAIARDLQVSVGTIQNVVHENLRYKSYVMKKGQFMSAQTQQQHLLHSKCLLSKVKHPEERGRLWFFYDEKNFTQDQKFNRRNDRWLCSDPAVVPRVMHTKFPANVMVLGVLSNDCHVMPPHIFAQGLRVNARAYIGVVEGVVKPWIDSVRNGRSYIFPQDSTPAHKAMVTQDGMAANLHDHVTPNIWPPNSPDLNPLDCYMWGMLEHETNRCPNNTVDALKVAIVTAMSSLNKDHLIRVCQRFQSCIEALIEADGSYFK